MENVFKKSSKWGYGHFKQIRNDRAWGKVRPVIKNVSKNSRIKTKENIKYGK